MRVSKECENCLRRLLLQAATFATDDEALKRSAVNRAEVILQDKFTPGAVSIVIATSIHDAIKQNTWNPDPYRQMKDVEIDVARQLYGLVKDSYRENFQDYLRLAALGNSIDFFRPIEEVKKEIKRQIITFAIDDSRRLEGKVKNSKLILYLADNAGEVFFDLPLLKLMRKYSRAVYVVKDAPVQNDITIGDIKIAGLENEVGELMTTGTATPGIDFEQASHEFKQAFESADLVFAKGMGYYETLEELPPRGRIFFCLKAKCRPVAESLKVALNSYAALLK